MAVENVARVLRDSPFQCLIPVDRERERESVCFALFNTFFEIKAL